MLRAESIHRILIIRPSALGDVCRTVPVLATLRRGLPEAQIDWIVQDNFVDAVDEHPFLNEVIAFPRDRLATWWRNPTRTAELAAWFKSLRHRRYDLVLDCQGLGRSGLMALATGAPVRIGPANARELAHVAYTTRVAPPDSPHTVEQMMSLAMAADLDPDFDMRLYTGAEHREWWQAQRIECGIGGDPYAVIAPTARWPSKRWPDDRFASLVTELRERGMENVVIIGAPGEREQIPQLAALAQDDGNIIDLLGETTIGQTMAIIETSSLVIANDSAPLHMAVGFDRPLVALFGPTDPSKVGPFGRDDFVVRPHAHDLPGDVDFKDRAIGDSIMSKIALVDVLNAVDRAMQSASCASEPA